MTPPITLVNTYVRVDGKLNIDCISKIFIICGIPFGIIRLPILTNVNIIFTCFLIIYSLGVAGVIINFFDFFDDGFIDFAVASSVFQCFFLMFFDLVAIKRLHRYYNELNIFDNEVSCTPKMGKATIRNILQIIFVIAYFVIIFTVPYFVESLARVGLKFIPIVGCHIIEIYYIAHLLSLLIPRLRLINYYMELSLTNAKITKTTNVKEFGFTNSASNKALCKMDKLMNLYHTIIKSYNYLVEAIKWQLLVTIVAAFVSILCYSYRVSYALIKSEGAIITTVSRLGVSVGLILPLFAPCTVADQVHNEVIRLRELLASRLYENQLDKACRGIARALLAWTETRDLSFVLLRMLNIDISLPFKFVGLLVTYLIILLQFQKVINP